VPPEVLETIASSTNENEAIHFEAKQQHSRYERIWKDLTGDDIGAFIGAAMLMGVHPQSCLEDYWNCSEDKPIFPLQKYITRQRFEQTCRYLKVNYPHERLSREEYWIKVETLMSTLKAAT
jgi:hypothetical protein